MKRQLRKSWRTIGRKLDGARSFATNLVRSNSSYPYSHRNRYVSSMVSSTLSDNADDNDNVFEATTSDDLPMDDVRRTSITLIPCEFCHLQQSTDNILHHQNVCRQNPNYIRRRNLSPNRTTNVNRRRAVSDTISITPSAPPRTRSPSPTEGFSIPNHLQCPITHLLFRDPVVANDGHTYEREAIVRWLQGQKISPITRHPISIDKLNPSLTIKTMAEEFRAECRRKRLLYKYKLDVDLKKTEQIPFIKTNNKSIYQAEWIKNNSLSIDSNIILIHLTGENAEKIAEINCRLEPHPNIVQVLGRVEHNDTGILLVQEYSTTETLSQLIKNTDYKLSLIILDIILYQIAFALQHLTNAEIIHGNITTDNILIYHIDEIPENTLVKLTNIGDTEKSIDDIDTDKIAPEVLLKNYYSEKSDVYAFGILAREIYSLELKINDKDLIKRQNLYESCLVIDPNERPTFNELTKIISDLIHSEKCIL